MYSSLTRTLRGKVADPARYLLYNRILVVMAIVGVSAVMSDGILTPAISVLSAIGGITVAAPTLSAAGVAGISAAILFLLVLVQRFGTAKVSFLFSPIILVWFVSIVAIGIYYIAQVRGPDGLAACLHGDPSMDWPLTIANPRPRPALALHPTQPSAPS